MNTTEGTTPALSSASPAVEIRGDHFIIRCPEWCTETVEDHAKPWFSTFDRGGELNAYVAHEGPRFGFWSCSADQNILSGEIYPDVTLDAGAPNFDEPDDIRRHIADTQAALAWLESVR
ncbi:hypothetical protein [Pimelobacter simplex]|uniref:hypothetical protein n=1 Tax=Nocardioides simplex TaxID=2045 RepID=UPI0019348B0B|nr:hypothetical protein [Pimelobacter simplex]